MAATQNVMWSVRPALVPDDSCEKTVTDQIAMKQMDRWTN